MGKLSFLSKQCAQCGTTANQAMIRCRDCDHYFDPRMARIASRRTPLRSVSGRNNDPFAEILAKADELFGESGNFGRTSLTFDDILAQASDHPGGLPLDLQISAQARSHSRTVPKAATVRPPRVQPVKIEPTTVRTAPVAAAVVKTGQLAPAVPVQPKVSRGPVPEVVKVNTSPTTETIAPVETDRRDAKPPLTAAQQELIAALDEFEYGDDATERPAD